MTSGYNVPWASQSHFFPSFFSASWKISMKTRPIALRFNSGSSRPASAFKRNCASASTPKLRSNRSCGTSRALHCTRFCARARCRQTRSARARAPKARVSKVAATEESTPPESPHKTWSPSGTFIRIVFDQTCSAICGGSHVGWALPQRSKTKAFRSSRPSLGVRDFG